jgi:hypothetical protein
MAAGTTAKRYMISRSSLFPNVRISEYFLLIDSYQELEQRGEIDAFFWQLAISTTWRCIMRREKVNPVMRIDWFDTN